MRKNSAKTGAGSAKAEAGQTEAGKLEWIDPYDAREWTDAMFQIAEHRINARSSAPGRAIWQRTASALAARPKVWRKSKSPCASTPM